jgi:hypothetical protein
LEAFLAEANYSLERDEFVKNLKKLTRPYEVDIAATKEFLRERAQARRNLLAQLLEHPHLEDYLRYEDTGKVVREWLVTLSPEHINYLNFINAVNDFKQTTNRSITETRAQMVAYARKASK